MNDPEERRRSIVQMWTDGDYAQVAARFAPISEQLVAELAPTGLRVLDAATGTGNTAIELAFAGAEVDAFDLAEPLLEQARARAVAAGVEVRFRLGDLVDAPYPDATFDLVVSTFGAFTADAPVRAAHELVRVCRPGGRIVTTAWADEGVLAAFPQVVHERHADALPPAAHAPHRWAEPDGLAELFDGCPVDLEVERRQHPFEAPSLEALLTFFEEVSGPIQRLRAAVEGVGGSWADARTAVLDRWAELATPTTDGGVTIDGTYAIARLVRRG